MGTTLTIPLTGRPAWKTLETHARKMRDVHLRTLFTADPARGERLTAEGAGLFLDYSKNRVTDESLTLLVQLANAENDVLTILPATAIPAGPIVFAAFKTNPKVRRWESDAAGDALRVIEIAGGNAGFLPLEDGVEIKFSAGTYRSGDYWLIPARTATADIEWPYQVSTDDQRVWDFREPEGIRHAYAPLAILSLGTDGLPNVKSTRREITQLWKKV